MNHHRLPVELQSMIFDALHLQDLLTASHVATLWRAIALQHPTYWRTISFAAASSAAVDFFHARLAAGGHRTISLRVVFRSPVCDLRSAMILAIRQNLYRAHSVQLAIDIAYDSDIFAALTHPAPRLRELTIELRNANRSSDAMPRDLFAGQAPELREVRIGNIQLHVGRLPDVFAGITALLCWSSVVVIFPTAIFGRLKSLKKLDIFAKTLSLTPANDDEQPLPLGTHGLEHMEISVLSGGAAFVRRMASASVPSIAVGMLDHESVQLLLPDLQGQLEVLIYPIGEDHFVQYRSLATGLTRTFAARPKGTGWTFPRVHVDELAPRIQTLCTAAGLMPAYGALASCTRVVITLADGERLQPPAEALHVPCLRDIEISSSSPARMSATDLMAYLDAAFAPFSQVVRVALKDIVLDTDPGAVPVARSIVIQTTP